MATVSVKYFLSTDTGAPTLSGTAGSLITLLDAVLVDGYNSKTLDSLVVASNVATATIGAGGHGMTEGRVVTIAGATPSGLNGEWVVTGSTSTTFTFATSGISNQTATGTITSKFAPLGWSKAFSGTNLAAYKSTALAATGCYLRVDDSASSTARSALARGYETMSDINTYTGEFPTTAQIATSAICKSSTADSTARPWALVGDELIFYFSSAESQSSYPNAYSLMFFGDINSYASNDAYRCVFAGHNTATPTYSGSGTNGASIWAPTSGATVSVPHHVARNMAGTGASGSFVKYSIGSNSCIGYGRSTATYPALCDGGVHLFPVIASDSSTATNGHAQFRGVMPGIYEPYEASAGTNYTTVTISGRTYLIVNAADTNVTQGGGRAYFDVTGPWR